MADGLPFSVAPTILETEYGITAQNPFGDLSVASKSPLALDGWANLQNAVGVTLTNRLQQAQTLRSRTWEALARGR